MCDTCDEINGAEASIGPQGPIGPQGEQGPIGPAGPAGNTGATGETGPQGPQGEIGQSGEDGISTYSELAADATSGMADHYTLTLVEDDWVALGQILYIEEAGYYEVEASSVPGTISVVDLGYPDNDPSHLLAGAKVLPAGIRGETGATGPTGASGFTYETVDGNGIPAEATGPYQFLMRNSDNTGYEFISLEQLATLLATL